MYTTINAKYTKRSLKIVKVLCEETGNDRTQQLLHTQINWLLAGKMLKWVCEERQELRAL